MDYLLPSDSIAIEDARVFWFDEESLLFGLTEDFPLNISDHRAVYADLIVPAPIPIPAGLPLLLSALAGAALLRRRR